MPKDQLYHKDKTQIKLRGSAAYGEKKLWSEKKKKKKEFKSQLCYLLVCILAKNY